MTDSPGRDGTEPTQPLGNNYPGYTDPAYANPAPYGPGYQAPGEPSPYPPYGYEQYTGPYGPPYPPGQPPQPPKDPKSPQWLWLLAGFAVLMVVALVIALVIANSNRQQTVVAPGPSLPEPSFTTPTTPTPTTSPTPTTTAPSPTPIAPLPTTQESPSPTITPATTESVTYSVTGEGRVINITYTDTGGVPQTEFNVALPWTKQVELSSPAQSSARISIINVGRDVTCSVTINGVQVAQRTGSGLTFCVGSG